MKEIISNIKENWKETPNSVKFWNGLVLLGLIISGFIGLDLLLTELAIMSVFAFIIGMNSIGNEGVFDIHLWVWFTPLTWVMLVVGLTIYVCIKLYKNTIPKFNNWLDKK